jgi:SAM-dependent methyltransferase
MMQVRTEAEERALVDSLHPDIPGPSLSAGHLDRAQECLRALHNSVFEILDWGLEDQPDIDEALDKVWSAACKAGWGEAEVGVTIDELGLIHRSGGASEFRSSDDEMFDETAALEHLENEPQEAVRPSKRASTMGAITGTAAQNYLAERRNAPLWLAEQDVVANYFSHIADGGSVLDIPFRTGRFVDLYNSKGMQVSGFEFSSDMLQAAQDALGNEVYASIDAQIGRAEALPYADDSFDVVVCLRFLESSVPSRLVPVCLKEFRRVTKSNAVVCLNHGMGDVLGADPELPLKNRLSKDGIEKLIRDCGWHVVESRVFGETMTEQKRLWLLAVDKG